MRTLAEVEAAVASLSLEELAELERFVRTTRQSKSLNEQQSVLDLPPMNLGTMLRPLGAREEWYDEMLEGRM